MCTGWQIGHHSDFFCLHFLSLFIIKHCLIEISEHCNDFSMFVPNLCLIISTNITSFIYFCYKTTCLPKTQNVTSIFVIHRWNYIYYYHLTFTVYQKVTAWQFGEQYCYKYGNVLNLFTWKSMYDCLLIVHQVTKSMQYS